MTKGRRERADLTGPSQSSADGLLSGITSAYSRPSTRRTRDKRGALILQKPIGKLGQKEGSKACRYARVEARRTHKIETKNWSESIYNPVAIHLQYLPDAVLLARAWHHTRPQTEESRQDSSTCALAGLQHITRTSLARRIGKSELLLGHHAIQLTRISLSAIDVNAERS